MSRTLCRLAIVLAFFSLAAFAVVAAAQTAHPLLLRNPSLSRDRIAFVYADDIWTVPREGGEAQRLTSEGGVIAGPYYSPDGSQIAYSTRQNDLMNVYVIAADGGVPRRITWNPSGNLATGWTPDGKDVVFVSDRLSYSDFGRLFTAHADGRDRPPFCRCPPRRSARSAPTGRPLLTSRSSSGSRPGSIIAAGRPRRCGW